jgi:peptidoglycan biosynthesis protein MviN/MurJ (putative lipid II flippase)
MTVEFLSYLLVGLFFNSVFLLQVRVFYALKSWRFFIFVRAASMGLKVAIGLLLINTNWALALAGGTVALFALAFFALEGYLIIAKKLTYSADDRKLLVRAALIAVSTVAVMIGADYLVTQFVDVHRLVVGAVVGIAGLGVLVMLDQKLRVSGINLKKK